jgi:hypothetical protein
MTFEHKNGGTITVKGIGHDTYKGVAEWFYIGDVVWTDGSKGTGHRISPVHVCAGTDADMPAINALSAKLASYLKRKGTWHDDMHKRDGRVYRWTPNEPKGEEAL